VALAETAPLALTLTLVLAVVARGARAVDWSGAAAGLLVGGLVSAGLGLEGLGVLGLFFVGGSVATKIGWKRKTAKGTAESGGGARDARRVLAKGGIAALAAAAHALHPCPALAGAFAGALAAALADTLGTEIGTLARGTPRVLPTFRAAPAGTPGAVSWAGTAAGAVGGIVIAAGAGMLPIAAFDLRVGASIAAAGVLGSFVESAAAGAVGAGRRGGRLRNLLATGTGAAIGAAGAGLLP